MEPSFETVRGEVAFRDQILPVTTGGGTVAGGYGRIRVRTEIVHHREFWIWQDGVRHHFTLGPEPMPDTLPRDDVEVRFSGGLIYAIINHTTGEEMAYRPAETHGGAYRPYVPAAGGFDGGRSFALLLIVVLCVAGGGASLSLGPVGLLYGTAFVALVAGLGFLAIRHYDRKVIEDRTHNLRVDRLLRAARQDKP